MSLEEKPRYIIAQSLISVFNSRFYCDQFIIIIGINFTKTSKKFWTIGFAIVQTFLKISFNLNCNSRFSSFSLYFNCISFFSLAPFFLKIIHKINTEINTKIRILNSNVLVLFFRHNVLYLFVF